MKKYSPLLLALLISSTGCFLISCNKDEEPDAGPELNFDILSTDNLQVLETWESGWIKKGAKFGFGTGNPSVEFEYHSNGYISSYKLYRSFPSYSLSFEHQRDVNNLPVSSKYYDVDENLYTEISYEGGLIKSRATSSGQITTTWTYDQGQIQEIERTSPQDDLVTLVMYDHDSGSRNIVLVRAGQEVKNIEVAATEFPVSGYDIHGDLDLASLIEDPVFNEEQIFSHLLTSFDRENRFFGPELYAIPRYTFHDIVDAQLSTRFGDDALFTEVNTLINNDFYRSLWEQYSWNEGVIYFSSSTATDLSYELTGSFQEMKERVDALKASEGDLFVAVYGDSYTRMYVTGKEVYTVGSIKNMPTDEATKDRILLAVELYVQGLFNGSKEVTEEDLALLEEVKFELKLHSDVLDNPNGYVIESKEDLEALSQQIDNAPAIIRGRELRSYGNL